MNLIKRYTGKNNSELALHSDDDGYYVTETGAGWDKLIIARRSTLTVVEAIAYTDDIANHCPLCYKADAVMAH